MTALAIQPRPTCSKSFRLISVFRISAKFIVPALPRFCSRACCLPPHPFRLLPASFPRCFLCARFSCRSFCLSSPLSLFSPPAAFSLPTVPAVPHPRHTTFPRSPFKPRSPFLYSYLPYLSSPVFQVLSPLMHKPPFEPERRTDLSLPGWDMMCTLRRLPLPVHNLYALIASVPLASSQGSSSLLYAPPFLSSCLWRGC